MNPSLEMKRLTALAIPVGFCVAGLILAHHEMILSGFATTQFDPGDTRFCNYLLEHGYRWLTGWEHHRSLWSPPYFFPATDTLAYAENMLGTMPIYAVFRIAGFRVDTAFQLWIASLGVLNFTACYLLFRRCFRLEALAAATGAALFAYAGIRINQTMHYQVFPHFFTVVSVHAAYRLLADDLQLMPERQRIGWIALFFAGVTGQLYAGVYLGWYTAFAFSVAGLIALAVPYYRRPLLALLKAHPVALTLAAGLSAAAIAPLMLPYAEVGKQFGLRPFEEALTMIPVPQAWLHMGQFSWFYKPLAQWPVFRAIPMEHEQRCGFGLLTTALCLLGYGWSRKQRSVVLFGLALATILLTSTLYGAFTPWKLVYDFFPGAQAIRAVSRIGILLLLPVGLGVAVTLHRLSGLGKKGLAAAAGLAVLCLAEQGETTPAFDKAQTRADLAAITAQVGPHCQAFVFSPLQGYAPYWKYQLDAMMAGLERGLPTLNGYSGHNPPGWALGDTNLSHPGAEAAIGQGLSSWISAHRLDPARICWAKAALEEGPYRAAFLSQSVPTQMVAGQRYEVSLVFRNTAPPEWNAEQQFRLGSQAPRDNTLWGTNRVELPGRVLPGNEVSIRFQVTAPATPGTYPFQWRLVREYVMWFGAPSEAINVTVRAP